MAGSSQSTSTSRSQSTSDTYIPEYSQTPILNEVAQHARAMSDQVYSWGMDQFNKAQGDIDSVMRDALSYASPQRIAVDMGMAEAGVQQAGERGRLSAIRDLESYGIDPSSGRYAALDSANRVMTAAAAAGAGNQQRMADQAAGNAMRQQAISAGLQNRNFGSQVGRDANAFLQTAMALKYPPLGRTSQSTSATDSQSSSVQSDPAKDGGGGQQKGDGGGKQPGGGGGKQPAAAKPQKPEPTKDEGPKKPAKKPGEKEEPEDKKEPGPEEEEKPGQEGKELEGDKGPTQDSGKDPSERTQPEDTSTDEPTMPDVPFGLNPADQEPLEPPLTPSDQEPLEAPAQTMAGGGVDEAGMAGYDPYANQQVGAEAFGIDPITGLPTDTYQDQETLTSEADPAGALYTQEAGGGWGADTGDITQASYTPQDQTDMWSDIGQGTMEQPAEGATYDATYDQWTDPGYTDTYTDETGGADWTDAGDQGYQDQGYEDQYAGTDWGDYGDWTDAGDYGGDEYDYSDADYGGGYEDDYADWGDEDYYDAADEGYDDWTDAGDYEDYGEDDYTDYGNAEDYGDNSYEDYGEDDYTDYGNAEDYGDEEDYSGGGGYDDSGGESYDNSGGDYEGDSGGGEDYAARGGAVMRGRMRQGKRRARIMPPRRMRRRTGYAGGGPIPQQAGMRLDAPPRPPGAAMRAPQPQQASRPMRGAPMAAPGGPRPTPMGRGPRPMPGNFISANGMPPPTGMPQRMARGGAAGRPEPTQGGFVSRELSPSGGSQTDDVNARLNAGEFVIPKDVATWKGKEFFYKMIAQARKNRSAPNGGTDKPQTGFSNGGNSPSGGMR